MYTHGYGNVFIGNADAANRVGTQVRGEWACPRLATLRMRLSERMVKLSEADPKAAARLEKFLYSVHHCGNVEGF